MRIGIAIMAAAMALAGCQQEAAKTDAGAAPGPQLDSPAPESEPSRVFAPANDAARAAGGAQLTVSIAQRLPDSDQGDIQEILTLRGGNGLVVEAAITGAISPATQVQGQTLRALLNIPVEEPQVLVYRVSNETRPDGGGGVCGASAPDYVVYWEPSAPGEAGLKVLGVQGGAPGAAAARACTLLDYRRQ
ncbi:MAG: hypothetical protein KF700_04145 [Hyphomonadaceae bacterium]|nr:hypothetical protein [Hyphomonadaceae bacterium]